ncbi:hypothetical protein RMSM_00863 [Rhodopirellula maiorica SM1]|uniref:Uncharacterized protein n=1 Tax=Rhodopirellula maiorica SM1 TaxID=1265738 RepID=M5RSD7_9BACT|nr:hypothetical protein [Rhodopirellula maiorica]EMI22210.1 hypothetical protein RMSM_00863 [Rhodopirellula maiorica SM1]
MPLENVMRFLQIVMQFLEGVKGERMSDPMGLKLHLDRLTQQPGLDQPQFFRVKVELGR